jgi:hypothetical protein
VGGRPAGSVGRKAEWAGGLSRPVEKEGGGLEDLANWIVAQQGKEVFPII